MKATEVSPVALASVEERWRHCNKAGNRQEISRFKGMETDYHPIYYDDSNQEWKPYRSRYGQLKGLLIEPEDIASIDTMCKAIMSYARALKSEVRAMAMKAEIRATPGQNSFSFSDWEPPSSWSMTDTASRVRAVGWPAFRFLVENEGGRTKKKRSELRQFLKQQIGFLLDPAQLKTWLFTLYESATYDTLFRPWQLAPNQSPFLLGIAQLYGPLFDKMLNWFKTEDHLVSISWRRSLYLSYGVAALVSVPVTSIYRNFYGTAAIDMVEPALDAGTQLFLDMLKGWTRVLSAISPQLASQYYELMKGALDQRSSVGCALYRQAIEVISAFQRLPEAEDLRGEAGYLIHLPDEKMWQGLPFIRRVIPATTDKEVLWAKQSTWQYLRGAADLMSQAGFILMINAANNQWGGRHPPHLTHENGRCFDLDIAIPREPGNIDGQWDIVANLAKMKRVPDPNGRFTDESGKHFKLVPIVTQEKKPTTLTKVQKLAFWITIQALQLAGIEKILYADYENMAEALLHLVTRIPAFRGERPQAYSVGTRNPPVSTSGTTLVPAGTGPRLLLEMGHNDHLHVEILPVQGEGSPAVVPSPPLHTSYSQLYQWALERDKDKIFLESMFGKEGEQSQQEKEYQKWWVKRSHPKTDTSPDPSLLPLWNPLCFRL